MNTNEKCDIIDLANQIEIEMKKIGLWSSAEVPDVKVSGAFGADSMTFEEWLQFRFLPNLRQAAMTNAVPRTSSIAVAAIRNLDGVKGADMLIDLLSRLDRLTESTT